MHLQFKEVVAWVLLLCLLPLMAQAASPADRFPEIRRFFPTADRFGDFAGKPPAAPVYHGDKLLGYAFQTKDVAPFPGYSGEPINILVAIDTRGRIVGTRVLEQHEPILLVGIPVQKLYDFVRRYIGHKATDCIQVGGGGAGCTNVDAISSATVTSMVVNRTILQAAVEVAASRKLVPPITAQFLPPAHVRMRVFTKAGWSRLLGNGAVRHLLVTRQQVERAFKGMPKGEVVRTESEPGRCQGSAHGQDCNAFIDVYYAYLNAPTIGHNVLGDSQYQWLMGQLKPGEHAIAVMANGVYSFKGVGYVRGGIFDRVHVMQDGQIILFHDLDYYRLSDVYAQGMPHFNEKAIFIIRSGARFDPGKPWQLQLLVRRQIGPLKSVYAAFTGDYQLPVAYFTRPNPLPAAAAQSGGPMWVQAWHAHPVRIGVLIGALVVLIVILVLQDVLVRRDAFMRYARSGYLVFTLFFIGWYALGQLSIVNVFTFVNAIMHGFRWETFLIDPVIFILWTFVAAALLLWGRGVFCGWLCPFGALQKLVNEIARRLRVPQFTLPAMVHERLWAIKYLILLVLFGVSLQSLGTAERFAEVEPFKTAIMLHFDRQWPFVLYAAALLAVSAFNSKFYCKYLCPLGAALAIPARLRLFEWLRRRKECGKPCQICANECEIQAIRDTGEINVNECHYCLDCQVTYWSDRKCPPLVERRKRRERASKARESARRMEEVLGSGPESEKEVVHVEPPQR